MRAGKLEETLRSCRHVYSLLAGASATDTLYSLIADPTDGHNVATREFSGGVYICLQNKSDPWPSGYIMTGMHNAISHLSCYITMYLQNMVRAKGHGLREPDLHHFGQLAFSLHHFKIRFASLKQAVDYSNLELLYRDIIVHMQDRMTPEQE